MGEYAYNNIIKAKKAKGYKETEINIGKEYKKDFKNQMELQHGTKIANLLSILKSGLLMPKYSQGKATEYNSYWAKPNISGILNDEIIIFNNNKIKLKYLLEIEL